MKKINSITIDVEDYFQVSALENTINRKNSDSLEHRVEQNLQKVLTLLSEKNVKDKFFTLGWIAERCPSLIKTIVAEGHELASNGYGHQRVSDLSKKEFQADVIKAKTIHENISGQPVFWLSRSKLFYR